MANQPTSYTGYWAATALAILMPKVGGTTPITPSSGFALDQFQTVIDLRSGEFDQAAAKAGYAVPIPTSATAGYKVAQRITRDGALADALRTIYTGPDSKVPSRYEAAFQAALDQIRSGEMPIPGAPDDTGTSNRLLPVWDGVASAQIAATMGYPFSGIPNDF